jgi:hypothetical protein
MTSKVTDRPPFSSGNKSLLINRKSFFYCRQLSTTDSHKVKSNCFRNGGNNQMVESNCILRAGNSKRLEAIAFKPQAIVKRLEAIAFKPLATVKRLKVIAFARVFLVLI